MTTVRAQLVGGLGNRMFIWSYAKAFCEANNYELRTEPWIGERLFTLDRFEARRPTGKEGIVIGEYRQSQKDIIYTRKDCRRWFVLRSDIARVVYHNPASSGIVAHRRTGDYAGAGYPVVSEKCVRRACEAAGYDPYQLNVVTEETASRQAFFDDIGAPYFPDFTRMTLARVLFRANSSFSWWAAVLSNARVFAPVITGFAGGMEHDDIPYAEGNWPRLCGLDFVTDLHLKEA